VFSKCERPTFTPTQNSAHNYSDEDDDNTSLTDFQITMSHALCVWRYQTLYTSKRVHCHVFMFPRALSNCGYIPLTDATRECVRRSGCVGQAELGAVLYRTSPASCP
jgi:hypothetical protein